MSVDEKSGIDASRFAPHAVCSETGRHLVQFYEDEAFLPDAVNRFISVGPAADRWQAKKLSDFLKNGERPMESLEQLLEAADLKHPCDLDLLLFFARHPDALMTSEQLASLVGYDLQEIAKSLDPLVERKLLRRSQNSKHPARLYRFRADYWDTNFQEILKSASTIEGRRRIRDVLKQRQYKSNRTI